MEELGGYPVDIFMEDICRDLVCGICYDVLKNPHQCRNGHCFCLTCVKKALTVNQHCPTCKVRMSSDSVIVNLVARNMVEKLDVICVNKCGWTGPVTSTVEHKSSECLFETVKCSAIGDCDCIGSILRGKLANHLKLSSNLQSLIDSSDVHKIEAKIEKYIGESRDGQRHGWGLMKWCGGLVSVWGLMKWSNDLVSVGQWVNDCMTGHGLIYYTDPSLNPTRYCGEFLNDLYHGHGKLLDMRGDIFVGPFQNGLKHGSNGVLTLRNSVIKTITGEWAMNKPTGEMVVTYRNGNVYTGEIKHLTPHGEGKIRSSNDRVIYSGQWRRGLKHGHGFYNYNNGDRYEGQWHKDKRHGQGMIRLEDDDVYTGQWINDIISGQGVYCYEDGDVFEGQFECGKFNGHGVYTSADGDIYTGEWYNGSMQGEGTMKFANGDIFVGTWLDHEMSHGELTHANGDVYTGSFYDNLMHGDGELRFANGDHYCGGFYDDIVEGIGVMKYANGDEYDGEWKGGACWGYGTHKYVILSEQYQGHWENDERCGDGMYTYACGAVFDGIWRCNVRCGQGVLHSSDGSEYHGVWNDDQIQRSCNAVTCSYANGDYFRGLFDEEIPLPEEMIYKNMCRTTGEWNGDGIKWYENGDVFRGQFIGGKPHGEGIFTKKSDDSMHDGFWLNGLKHGAAVITTSSGAKYETVWSEGKMVSIDKKRPGKEVVEEEQNGGVKRQKV